MTNAIGYWLFEASVGKRLGFLEPVLLKPCIRVNTCLIILSVFFLLIWKVNGKPEPTYCKYSRKPTAMCYCENCPEYNTCMKLCHENLNGKPEIIKLQDGYFPEMYIESNTPASIERLTLSNCSIREIDRDFFKLYTSLIRFAVFDNEINDRKAPLELNLTKNLALIKVELFRNALTKFPRIYSDTVEYLDLRYNKISSVTPGDLASLKKLKTLDLDDNQLTTIGFVESPGLQIYLTNNNFPCNSATYCEFEQNRDHIAADYGVYCKSKDGAMMRFADEGGLLPDFQCFQSKIQNILSSSPKTTPPSVEPSSCLNGPFFKHIPHVIGIFFFFFLLIVCIRGVTTGCSGRSPNTGSRRGLITTDAKL